MHKVVRFISSGLLLGLLWVIAAGQASQTGGISGVVTDKNGGLVNGATVDIISDQTGKSVHTTNTNDTGGYSVSLLPPGTYKIEVTAQNFKKSSVAGVQVRITETTRQDVTLEPGNIQETVNIEAAPTLINT